MNKKQLAILLSLGLTSGLTACVSSNSPVQQEPQQDIYSSLTDGEVEYREEEAPLSKRSPEYIQQQVSEIRALYYRNQQEEAQALAERVIRLDSTVAEVYYWLAQIAINKGDWATAGSMIQKGIMHAEDANMKAELERMQEMVQMGTL